jgi:hypothetical protein
LRAKQLKLPQQQAKNLRVYGSKPTGPEKGTCATVLERGMKKLFKMPPSKVRTTHSTVGSIASTEHAHARTDVSIFTSMFGEDWDLINRIAADPAHEFHNLVKDLLKLISNKGSMKFKEAR